MLKLNVNGSVYNNGDSCKLYNLSAQELYALDIFITTNNADAWEWLAGWNEDATPKISLEIDRYTDGETIVSGQIFEINYDRPGLSFSNPIVYKRADRTIGGLPLDDNAHIQRLPSHNSTFQQPVRMIGGSTESEVGAQWGRVRAVAPQSITDVDEINAFYDNISEWYINLATRDDFISLNVIVSPSTNLAELDSFMQSVTIVVQPSLKERLKKNYMYYDIDNEAPQTESTGVTY